MFVSVSAFSAPPSGHDEDDNYCGDLIEYLGLQTHHAKVRQWGRVPTRDLERRIEALRKRLFDPEERSRVVSKSEARTEAEWSPDTDSGFTPYTEWQPEAGFGEWTPESEREQDANQPSHEEMTYFPVERELDQLEEYLASHESGDATARVDAVFRRIAVERFVKAGTYRKALDHVGVLSPTQQQLALELWMHETTRRQTSGVTNDTKQLARFADVLNMDAGDALRYLESLDLSQRRANETPREQTFQEIVDSLAAGRGDYSPQTLRTALRQFHRNNTIYPTETFGKLLHYFLGNNDDLVGIRDAETLHKYLVAHQE